MSSVKHASNLSAIGGTWLRQLLLFCFGVAMTSAQQPSVDLYGQCGGKSNCPSSISNCGDVAWAHCPTASQCVRQQEYYWQCLPADNNNNGGGTSGGGTSGGGTSGGGTSGGGTSGGGTSGGGTSGGGTSGDGWHDAITTRYWDCCKPSCSWTGNLHSQSLSPVRSCQSDGTTTTSPDTASGCDNANGAFACTDQAPFSGATSQQLYFTAAAVNLGGTTDLCCKCFELQFTDQRLQGKSAVVQITNSGGLGAEHFDLAIPGGGVGDYGHGCQNQYPGTPLQNWGKTYGGLIDAGIGSCNGLPQQLQAGCSAQFGFMQGVSNPSVRYRSVSCPAALTSITGCG